MAYTEKQKAWEKANAQRRRAARAASQRDYRARHPEKAQAVRIASDHRARTGRAEGLSSTDILALRATETHCIYCFKPANHIDHCTPLSRAGSNTIDNCVIICKSCNSRKFRKTPLEFVFGWPSLDVRPGAVL